MKKFNKLIGNYGEDIALNFVKDKNYKILDRNFRTKKGEIDLICKHKEIIIFIEIKSRYSSSLGNPCESVTYFKQKQIINLSNYYIYKFNLYNYNFRFDVIEIFFNTKDESFIINHIEDAFRTY